MANQSTSKQNNPSRLKDLILLFSVPAGIAVIAAIAVYGPNLFANPKYDFIYSYCSEYDCTNHYFVNGSGQLAVQSESASDPAYRYKGNAVLRYYDASEDSTKDITVEQAQSYNLNTSSRSPDGYILEQERSESGFLFWGGNDTGWYLKNGIRKKMVTLENDNYYSDNVRFFGWVNK